MSTQQELLQYALKGYEHTLEGIDAEIKRIKALLKQDTPTDISTGKKPRKPMSKAARKRIAAAQKKRWAAYHKQQKVA